MTTETKDLWRRQRTNFPWHETVDADGIFISFVVPCFNEEDNLADTLHEIVRCMARVGRTFEIIVIDDCSTDRTVEKVQAYMQANPDLPVRLRRNLVNQGWAQNFVDGAFVSRGKYYRMIPGDNVERAEEMYKVVSLAGTADLVIPYQTVAEGKPRFRVMLSGLFTRIVNLLSGNSIKYYNGCTLYSTFDIMRWHVSTGGYGFQAETLTRLLRLGFTYVEVDVHAFDRLGGKSKAINFINFLSATHSLSEMFLQRIRGNFVKEPK